MATPVSSRPKSKRFLGNTKKMAVHDLRKEQVGCQIDKIIAAGHAVTFSPDTLAQAKAEGYDACGSCVGGSRR